MSTLSEAAARPTSLIVHDYRLAKMFHVPTVRRSKACDGSTLIHGSMLRDNIEDTLRFITDNCLNLSDLMDDLVGNNLREEKPPALPIFNLASEIHLVHTRKATNDPYMKHVLYTTYLANEIGRDKNYNNEEKLLILGGALLHDAIEMTRKHEPSYGEREFYALIKRECPLDEKTLRKLLTIVSVLTPDLKDPNAADNDWFDAKEKDFEGIMNVTAAAIQEKYDYMFPILIDKSPDAQQELSPQEAESLAKIIKDIKIADEVANARETADDVISGKDGKKIHPGLKSLSARVVTFRDRLNFINENHTDNSMIYRLVEDTEYLEEVVWGDLFEKARR